MSGFPGFFYHSNNSLGINPGQFLSEGGSLYYSLDSKDNALWFTNLCCTAHGQFVDGLIMEKFRGVGWGGKELVIFLGDGETQNSVYVWPLKSTFFQMGSEILQTFALCAKEQFNTE